MYHIYLVLTLSLPKLLCIWGPSEFCAHGTSQTMCRWSDGEESIHILHVFLLIALFHQTSLTKHKFKDKIPRWWQACILSHSVMSSSLWSHKLQPTRLFLSMGFFRKTHWSGLPFSSPRDLPNPGIEPGFPALQADSLPSEPGKPPRENGEAPQGKWWSKAIHQAQGPSELRGLTQRYSSHSTEASSANTIFRGDFCE